MKALPFHYLLVFVLHLSCGSHHHVIHDDEKTGILDNFERQKECWNNGDLKCYMEAYMDTPNVQTISRAGVTLGKSNILAQYMKYFPPDKMGNLEFDNFTFKKLSPKFIYVVGRFNLDFGNQDKIHQGWFSVLMEKHHQKWYIISDHSS